MVVLQISFSRKAKSNFHKSKIGPSIFSEVSLISDGLNIIREFGKEKLTALDAQDEMGL